ncbi:MAG: HAD family hydrolase [Deltaproteobacteria bacterium]
MKNRKTIIWDFDGTLSCGQKLWSKAMMFALDTYMPNHNISVEHIIPYLKDTFPWHKADIAHPELSTPSSWWNYTENIMSNAYINAGLSPSSSKVLASLAHEKYISPDSYTLYPNAKNILHSLKQSGWQHIILSNHVPELPDIIKAKGLSEFISHCISSANIGYEKPNIQSFKIALDIIGYPEKAVMIGDNIQADIKGAEQAGIPAILVHTPASDTVKYHASTLDDIPFIIDSIFN